MIKVRNHTKISSGGKLIRVKKHYRGGALSDYIPQVVKDTYNDTKAVYGTVKGAVDLYNDVRRPLPEGPPIPPPPPGGLKLSKADRLHNQKLKKQYEEFPSIAPSPYGNLQDSDAIKALKTIRPLNFIDSSLKQLGYRDKVRDYIGKSKLGKSIINLVDRGIHYGFGAYRGGSLFGIPVIITKRRRPIKRNKRKYIRKINLLKYRYL